MTLRGAWRSTFAILGLTPRYQESSLHPTPPAPGPGPRGRRGRRGQAGPSGTRRSGEIRPVPACPGQATEDEPGPARRGELGGRAGLGGAAGGRWCGGDVGADVESEQKPVLWSRLG